MATQQGKGRPLPKFGEWDVNNPASAEGFTVIFSKARDEKKSNVANAAVARPPSQRNVARVPDEQYQHTPTVPAVTFSIPFNSLSRIHKQQK
ncbi:RPM1-interacting protein 4 isoform X1 [Citrus clementina]|uniref:RPM1-interacting protein 4 isoform X1 n=1 Tax=Citrus clementina TaxID=85681 RepID=UPI0003D77BDF|nr:RPM1-interacting protein 4 isoform X1 [Citrus x clementina]